jgi:hypothetical protein
MTFRPVPPLRAACHERHPQVRDLSLKTLRA